MSVKVLVTYGTKYGATAEIAEKIAEVIEKAGNTVDVMDVNHVDGIGDYHTVILGSAVYMGQWRREMVKFIDRNATELAQKKVWVFASGTTNDEDPVKDMGDRPFPPKLKPAFDTISPVEITAFHGSIDVSKLSGFEKWIIKKVNAPIGDHRDWEMIKDWGEKILNAIK